MNGAIAAQAATPIVQAVQQSDPLLVSLAWLAAVVIAMVAVGKPLMGLYREYKNTKVEGAKASAEDSLYENLKKQLEANTAAITILQKEKDEWFRKAVHLENEVAKLKVFEAMVESMRERLNEKDKVIEERDTEIRTQMTSILTLTERIHKLEMRLQLDEQQFCKSCDRRERPRFKAE